MPSVASILSAAGLAAAILAVGATDAFAVKRKNETVAGLKVVTFSWNDSAGRKRSVSLKREGEGNPGHGGYAVRMTYRYDDAGKLKTLKAIAPKTRDGGFGYFVAHERYRTFADGDQAPIAAKIFGADDSPLGLGFPVKQKTVLDEPGRKAVEFKLAYPKYGTRSPGGIDQNTGEDKPRIGTDAGLFKRYDLPVTIRWTFEDGKDHPRIAVKVDLGKVPGPDRLSFDVRGPYGKLDFDDGEAAIAKVMWADRFAFETTASPVTRNATWTWNAPNAGARFTALIAGSREMGIVEPRPFAQSLTNDGYSDGRGKTSATYFGGNGCPFQDQIIPCDYEWPYQSAQYELPYDNRNGATTSEKIAWGSTPYYGMSLSSTYDGTQSVAFDGFPADRSIDYDVCVVLGPTTAGGLTRAVAAGGGDYSCASGG
ncbi:hypothetical protein [Chenggangzhangella methanolivorans]|uniref:Uncharacterized protein n=1 Tax=Chenggangzhangella methanolivorans TaxID=1437009 RepID=A0A9E6RFB3_9HYPH|nr:hypothetical protein [Chenggangzhangella methanolivorans]QZO00186.1 hypothetical protein K6K41_27280 [Chenggangzhangella methanolivorans]